MEMGGEGICFQGLIWEVCDWCLPILLKYLKNALDLSLGRGALVPDNPAQGIKDKYVIPSSKGLQTAQVMGAVLL